MQKIFRIFVAISGIWLFGCGRQDTAPELEDLFPPSAEMQAPTRMMGALEGNASDGEYFVASCGRFVVGSNRTDPAITIFDTMTFRSVGVVRKGKGPNEVIYIGSLHENDGDLYVYNTLAKQVLTVPVVAEKLAPSFARQVVDVDYMEMLPIAGRRHVGSGSSASDDQQFYLLDSMGKRVEAIDDYVPDPEGRTIASYDNAFGQQGPLLRSPDGRHFMYASRDGLVLKFFRVDDDHARKIREYIVQAPLFTPMSDPEARFYTVAVDPNNLQGVESLTADDRYYYLLFSERLLSDEVSEADQLLVFDHAGEPVARIRLDRPVNRIAADSRSGKLYALIQESEQNRVAEILLPEL